MKLIKPAWLSHSGKDHTKPAPLRRSTDPMLMFGMLCFATGEQKDFEVYSCHVSPDGSRLATAGGGMRTLAPASRDWITISNM